MSYAYRKCDYARPRTRRPTRKNVKGPRVMTTPPTPIPAPVASGATPTARVGARLRNGELRRQVAGFLAAGTGKEFTPGEVARGLPDGPRSAGAVRNALAVLADRGEAQQTSTKPLRYQASPTTATASTAPNSAHPPRTPRTAAPPPATSAIPAPPAPVEPAATARYLVR